MPPPPAAAPGVPDATALAAAAPAQQLGGGTFPSVDPSMAQAYAQMFSSYLQQAQAYAGLGADPGMASAAPFAASPSNFSCGTTPGIPAISVCVEGMKFQYQLTDDDLQKVFSRYGAVREIRVDEVGTVAHIAFDDFVYAQAAMNDLNGKVLNGLE